MFGSGQKHGHSQSRRGLVEAGAGSHGLSSGERNSFNTYMLTSGAVLITFAHVSLYLSRKLFCWMQ